ncbi:replication-relaxation family protein [Streptomyces tailanensis]|uniref:replication-relaxation family protein n=1 Tax=Streptomyces tailanensis TaxID=2569858 RepID=UPI00122E239C|nr:replication-relaxation family protein [Streptomyces tailanensis]
MEKHPQLYPQPRPRPDPVRITAVDDSILRAVNQFHYMTASQVSRLLYPEARDENRYAQRRLRRLAEAGYLMRLRELPAPRVGSAPHVFTLADKGRQYLSGRGVGLSNAYFRPSEERRKAQDNPFMEHTLAAVDVLVAAESLCRKFRVAMLRMLAERQLKRTNIRVTPAGQPDARPVAVIPDAWFELQVLDEPPVAIALELDRSTEHQKHWRRKVAALAAWAEGPYRQAFGSDNLTVAVVTPSTQRRVQLSDWTIRELDEIHKTSLSQIFLFTEASPVTIPPEVFFFELLWYTPEERKPMSLLDMTETPLEDDSDLVVALVQYKMGGERRIE